MTEPVDPTVALVPTEGRVYSAPHLVRVDARRTLSIPTPTDAVIS
jgi:hypothetical protein